MRLRKSAYQRAFNMCFKLTILLLCIDSVNAMQDYMLDRHPTRVAPANHSSNQMLPAHLTKNVPPHLLHLYDSKCHNGIVGLFCESTGCYYNSDCFDGHCNMYSKCEQRKRSAQVTEMVE